MINPSETVRAFKARLDKLVTNMANAVPDEIPLLVFEHVMLLQKVFTVEFVFSHHPLVDFVQGVAVPFCFFYVAHISFPPLHCLHIFHSHIGFTSWKEKILRNKQNWKSRRSSNNQKWKLEQTQAEVEKERESSEVQSQRKLQSLETQIRQERERFVLWVVGVCEVYTVWIGF